MKFVLGNKKTYPSDYELIIFSVMGSDPGLFYDKFFYLNYFGWKLKNELVYFDQFTTELSDILDTMPLEDLCYWEYVNFIKISWKDHVYNLFSKLDSLIYKIKSLFNKKY